MSQQGVGADQGHGREGGQQVETPLSAGEREEDQTDRHPRQKKAPGAPRLRVSDALRPAEDLAPPDQVGDGPEQGPRQEVDGKLIEIVVEGAGV